MSFGASNRFFRKVGEAAQIIATIHDESAIAKAFRLRHRHSALSGPHITFMAALTFVTNGGRVDE